MAEVLHLFFCLRHRLPMREVQEIDAVAGKGLKGCAHGRPGSPRQVLLMESEALAEFGLVPGAAKENITTRGIGLQRLPRGQRLRVGQALFEVSLACEPCGRMDDLRPGLQQVMRGRRGMLCRVVEGGLIRRGDGIELVQAVETTPRGAIQ